MNLLTHIKNNIEIIIFFGLVVCFLLFVIRRNWEGFYNEQNGINRLDAIIYINLNMDNDDEDENDSDNTYLLMEELEKLNANMNKIHKASKSTGIFIPKNGHNGNLQSHILALKMIKNNKWKRVLVLEDDAKIDMQPYEFNDLLNKTLNSLDDKYSNWDVIMLSTENKLIDNKTETISIDTLQTEMKIQKIKNAKSSLAYIIKDTYVDNILNLFDLPNLLNNDDYSTLEQKWSELQIKDNWFSLDKDPITKR